MTLGESKLKNSQKVLIKYLSLNTLFLLITLIFTPKSYVLAFSPLSYVFIPSPYTLIFTA